MYALGIDLGTTNCVAAYVDATGVPRSVVNFEGDVLTPSAIVLEEERRMVVGREALKLATRSPEIYTECFKREMGREDHQVNVAGQTFRPEFLSAVLLKRLKNDFERTLGAAKSVVITVPAFFDESRRRATRNAGQIAGWDVADIINEPTAAALTYARQHDSRLNQLDTPKRVLVYDLGGGTFDCTLLEITPRREYRTLATDGEVQLGGLDWDRRLAQHLAEQFEKKTSTKLQSTPLTESTLLRIARQMKHKLSSSQKADAPVSLEGKRALLEVTRDSFQSQTRDLLDRTRMTTSLVLEAANCGWQDVSSVLLVGGSSRMPMVAEMLRQVSGMEPEVSPVIDEAVAHGAALYAQQLHTANSARIINVNAHSLRIVGRKNGERVAALFIPKNTPLPASRAKIYPLARLEQTSVAVELCEGECDEPELCEALGTVVVSDLPPSNGAPWKVAVAVEYQADGSVKVAAQVRDPHQVERVIKVANATLVPSRGLTADQIAAQIRRLQQYEIV